MSGISKGFRSRFNIIVFDMLIYDNSARIAKKAFEENMTLKEAAIKLGLVSDKDFDKIVDPKKMI